jgi:DNA polymerase-1
MTAKTPPTLHLVDGTSQLYRAYFAIRGLTTAAGMPTNAIYGFTTMLRKLLQDERPEYIAVAFDRGMSTARTEAFPEYKATRPETPDDLQVQKPYARRVCEALRIPVLEHRGVEADDLIATLTRKAREAGFAVVVVASDKDMLQLVGDGVTVFNPSKNVHLDPAGVADSFGVPPERVLDVQGLMGDSVDNIPGVPGVGEKTAKSAVSTYGGLDAILARAAAFVRAYDARDRVLEALAAVEQQAELDAEAAARVAESVESFAAEIADLVEIEVDPAMRDRFEAAARIAGSAPASELAGHLGKPGKKAAAGLRELKKTLKGLDPKSARRTWYAIHEHAEQARMSKSLATLLVDAPVELDPDALRLGPPDREAARSLFQSLGFQSLVDEYAGEAAEEPGSAAPTVAAEYTTVLDGDALERLVASCREAGRLAVHAETDETDPLRAPLCGVSLAPQAGTGAYVPLAHDYLDVPAQLALQAVRERLAPLLADPAVGKVGADIKRTIHLLGRHGMPVDGFALDVSVGAFLLNPSRSRYDRRGLAGELLGRTTRTPDEVFGSGAKRKPLRQIDVDSATRWAAEGVDLTLQLADAIEPRLEQDGLLELYREIDGPLLPLLARMERRGIRIDRELLAEMSAEMEASLARSRREIHALAGTEFNIDSPKQLREVLFERLGLTPKRKTAKSKVASTDAQTLEELAEEHAIAAKILEYRELAKLKGTYVDALPQLVNPETGRVHTSFHPTGAATGRLSSSDPNLQNIPVRTPAGRRVRAGFVPEPGHVFLASDYSQIELRILAHVCEDAELIRAFREGQDIHRHTAALVAGVMPDLVTDTMRRRAKAVNFGILYGMSEFRLAREQGMTRPEARDFIRAYFDRFPAVRGYIERTRDEARRDGAVHTLFGRVRYFPRLHQRVNRAVQEQSLRAAVNTTLQGTAADLMKMAMLAVDRELALAGFGNHILLQVHDELLIEVPEEAVDDVAPRVRRAMEGVHELRVPLVVDQKVGANWEQAT